MSLFGDLFDDELESSNRHDTPCDNRKQASDGSAAPLAPRSSHGFCGIFNQGATCYLNSLIQTLVMTPEFREALFRVGESELGCLKDKDKPGAKVRVIPIHLQRLIARLLLLNAQGVKTSDLTDSFGWTNNEEREQHDVQELNRILFCAIEDSLVGTSGEKFIRTLYHGTIVNQIKCDECGNISEKEEDFLDLCLTVSGCSSLEESLTRSYVEVESLYSSNRYHCSKCSKLTDAVKGARIRHLPPVLTVSLLRFNFDFVKMERYKEVGKFYFPTSLNMAKYCENVGGSDFCSDYELFSVVIHRGSTHGGHYHAYIRDIDNIGRWIHPDEEEIRLVPSGGMSSPLDVIECDSCEAVLKTILQKTDRKSGMTVDALCAELIKQTGVSWNKRFKKQNGPITKFLAKCSNVFVYNPDVNWVSLKEPNSSTDGASVAEGDVCQQTKFKESNRTLSPAPDPGHCWFDFDDLHIRPIRPKDIETQFSGKESAYMLFYRSKSLIRPSEASRNPSFGIPEPVICDIAKENSDLEQMRALHLTRMNVVSVEIHFGASYYYSNGALHPLSGACACMELSIDKRKTVADLLSVLTKEVDADLVGNSLVLHLAKELPAGLHLYQNLTDDLEATLASYGIDNSTKIFVWDGSQVGGEAVPFGVHCEPLLLNIICSNEIEFNCGFAKNMRIGELKEAISSRSGIPYQRLQLTLLRDADLTSSSGEQLDGILSDEKKMLSELKLDNCNYIYAMDLSSSSGQLYMLDVKSTDAKIPMSFSVENRCSDQSTSSSGQTVTVKIDKESTIEELKAVALSQLVLQEMDPALTRLRVDDSGLAVKPPLYEHETISSTGLTDGTQLLLEPGNPPMQNEVMLFVSVVKSSKVTTSLELLVEKKMKVDKLLELAISAAGLDCSEWHLCRLDWNGEPLEILDDVDMSVEGCHLKHGDQLSLEFGRMPPKGFLKLSVYLFPNESSSSHQQPGYLQQLSTKLQEWLTFQNNEEDNDASSQTVYKPLGTIIISKLATLSDLKEQIMTLDGLSKFSIPTVKFLRLRLLRSKQLGHVLRLHLQMLQKLKLVSGCEIGVQVLTDEEDLSQNHMLLTVCLRSSDNRQYVERRELIWDLSQGANLPQLRRAVANLYHLPEQNLRLAKHLRDKYEWIILTDQTAAAGGGAQKVVKQKGKGKGKKKEPAKLDLRHSPFHLQDGDVIGVKILQEGGSVSDDDFRTAEDDEGKEKLMKEAEEVRKRREEKHKRSSEAEEEKAGTIQPKGRPELAIKIHVDNFS